MPQLNLRTSYSGKDFLAQLSTLSLLLTGKYIQLTVYRTGQKFVYSGKFAGFDGDRCVMMTLEDCLTLEASTASTLSPFCSRAAFMRFGSSMLEQSLSIEMFEKGIVLHMREDDRWQKERSIHTFYVIEILGSFYQPEKK